jgi:hypothetical protein
MWHHVIALHLSLATRLARLQLAVAAVCHVLMFLNMRRPQTRREQVAGLVTVSGVRSVGRSLYSDHYERVASAEAGGEEGYREEWTLRSSQDRGYHVIILAQGSGGTGGFSDLVSTLLVVDEEPGSGRCRE